MTVSLSPILNGFQSFTSAGLPNAGGFLYTYAAGTSTLQTTYTASNGSTPNANPIVFDSAGRAPQGIWLTDGLAYKLILADSTTAPIAGCTYDNVGFGVGFTAANGSFLVGYTQGGTGAVATTVQGKLQERVSVLDFGTPTQAVSAITTSGTGTLLIPANSSVVLPTIYPAVVVEYLSQTNQNVYAESETNRLAKRLLKAQSGAHTGTQQIGAFGIEHRPIGGGFNGAANADLGVNISVIKQGYLTSTTQGEIDGLNIVVRQGGSAGNGSTLNSDCAGILVDVAIKTGVGFSAAFEASTAILSAVGVTTRQIQTQIGVLDDTLNLFIGFVANATTGAIDDGIRLLSSGTGSYTNFLNFKNNNAVTLFAVDGLGRLKISAPSGVTPSKTIRSINGTLSVLNDAQTIEIFTLDDFGNLSVNAINSLTQTLTSATPVVSAGKLGFGTTTSTTVGAAGAAAAIPNPAGYLVINISGTFYKLPYVNT